MQIAIDKFRDNIAYVKNLATIHTGLTSITTSALDLSDILRAEIVLAVSAFDAFIHDLARIGMLEILQEQRPPTQAFLRFQVTMDAIIFSRSHPEMSEWIDRFDNLIREKPSWQSFQTPDKIAEAIRLISEVKLWDNVENQLDKDKSSLKEQLKVIIDRRNKIAHEADNIPSQPGERWPIDVNLTNNTIDFIEQLAETIYKVVG
jgi:hypothetical protein